MYYRPSDDVNIVIYEDQKYPRLFKIGKGSLRLLLILLPIITLISVAGFLGFIIYFSEVKESVKRQEPKIIQQLRNEKAELENTNLGLIKLNQSLEKKLSLKSGDTPALFPLFVPTPGRNNLHSKKQIILENLSIKVENKTLNIKVLMKNNRGDGEKLSGYAFIIARQLNKLVIYPTPEKNTEGKSMITYSMGESFGFKNFRPVKAKIKDITSLENLDLQLIVFNRVGDILYLNKLDEGSVSGKTGN